MTGKQRHVQQATPDPPVPAARAGGRWRSLLDTLRTRWARHLGLATVAIGGFIAIGHFLGGVIGWWHAYEFTFGKPPAVAPPPARDPASALSLAVLPIESVSGDADGEWLADALTSDLTTELGRLSGTFVISRDTTFAYKGKAIDPRVVAGELGVRYLVRGSARRQGDRVRLTLALVEGLTGSERWAETKDLDRATLSSSLGEAVDQLAHALNVQIYRAAGERAARMQESEIQAEDLAMHGWSVYFRGVSRENLAEAGRLFDASVGRDDRSIRGWGGVAVVNGLQIASGWIADRDAALGRLVQAQQRLQVLDANDVHTYYAKHFVALLNTDYEGVLALSASATERFPNQPQAHFARALAQINLGRFELEECIEPARRAIRLGPRDPALALWTRHIGTCHFMRGEYAEAVTHARAAQQINPNLATPSLLLAASLALDGRRDEARAVVDDLLRRNPAARASDVERLLRPNRNERVLQARRRWIETLQELGLP
jgi:TolB-like protein